MATPITIRHRVSATMRRLVSSLYFRLSKAHNEDGSAIVEFAMAASVLMSFIFGIAEVSLAAYAYFYVSYAAREASRYAMVRGSTLVTDCTTPGYATCIAQPADIQTYVRNLGFSGINSSKVKVTTTWLKSAGTACGTADACKPPGNRVKVTVTYAGPLNVPFVPKRTLTLNSTSQMVISQ